MIWTLSPKQVQSIPGKTVPFSGIYLSSSDVLHSFPTLGRCVEVPGLGIAQQVIFIVGEATEEEGTADQDNSGRPPEAVGPVIDVSDSRVEVKVKGLSVLHRVNYQGDDLEHS